jgi:hypothetical protein
MYHSTTLRSPRHTWQSSTFTPLFQELNCHSLPSLAPPPPAPVLSSRLDSNLKSLGRRQRRLPSIKVETSLSPWCCSWTLHKVWAPQTEDHMSPFDQDMVTQRLDCADRHIGKGDMMACPVSRSSSDSSINNHPVTNAQSYGQLQPICASI